MPEWGGVRKSAKLLYSTRESWKKKNNISNLMVVGDRRP